MSDGANTSGNKRVPPGPRWVKGQSGNPNGRPKVPAQVRDMARELTREALETAAECMRSRKAPRRRGLHGPP